MIGDIDFIIQHKDEEKVRKLLEKTTILIRPMLFNLFIKPKHLPRQINKNKTMAIEPTHRVIDHKEDRLFLIQKS